MKKRTFSFILSAIFILGCLFGCAAAREEGLDYSAFLELLAENGLQYDEAEPYACSFLYRTCNPVLIADEIISVYEYDSNAAMEADAACISRDGFSISFPDSEDGFGRAVNISWIALPHFFKKDTILVNYVGEDERILAFLRENLGAEFAGGVHVR